MFKVRRGLCTLLAAVVHSERTRARGVCRDGCVFGDRAAPAVHAPVPGLGEQHHLGVHVTPAHRVPQTLRLGGEPVRQRTRLQPVALLLRLRDGSMGEDLQQTHQRDCVTAFQHWVFY